ncbi:MAG: NlpC/P60 family protein [Lysinibacillus sp.]
MKKKWLLPIFASFMFFTFNPIDNAEAASTTELTSSATKYIGVPYVYGGTTTKGFDCSGYTSQVFSDIGIKLNRTSGSQYQQGTAVGKNDHQVGDLLFFNTSGRGISHVAIYIGNGQMIHSQPGKGVSYSKVDDPYYWGSRYVGAKRITTLTAEQQDQIAQKPTEEVKDAAIDFTVYASRGEVATQIAKALNLDTSNTNTGFADVKATNPQAGAIAAVTKAGIFSAPADANAKFNPASAITRAHVSKVIVNAFALKQQGAQVTFSDVSQSSWTYEYVSILASNGVTEGKNDGTFGLNDYVTHKHLSAFIERAQK